MDRAGRAILLLHKMKKCITRKSALASHQSNPFRVLVATILSHRTRDESTLNASRALFAKYHSPQAIARAPLKELERLVHCTGFYKEKARRVKETCKILLARFGGKVPTRLADLLSLPGVGRKTANCVLVYGFGIPAVPVDVHVHRLSNLFGLVKTKTPDETEFELVKIVPKRLWLELNETMVLFGKQVCKPGMMRAECEKAMARILETGKK